MNTVQLIFLPVLACATVAAMVLDLRYRRLPNWLTVPLFAAGLLYHLIGGALQSGWMGVLTGLGFSLGGFAIGFGLLFVLWITGGGSGGDVKLMGALGAWLGPWPTIWTLAGGAVLAIILTLIALALDRMKMLPAWLDPRRGVVGEADKTDEQSTFKKRQHARKRASAEGGGGTLKYKDARGVVPFGVPVGLAAWAVLIVFEFAMKR